MTSTLRPSPDDALEIRASSAKAHNEGIALAKRGDYELAVKRLVDAITIMGIDEVDPRSLKALWQIAKQAGNLRVSTIAGVAAAQRDPLDFAFVQLALRTLADCPISCMRTNPLQTLLPLPTGLPLLSIVIVSRDDRRFFSADEEYRRAFAQWPHERIRVKDARTMYDGYSRGYARSSGEIVVFSHDDIQFAVPDFAARLAMALSGADLVGIAGTTRLCAPGLLWSGHPNIFGTVTHYSPETKTYEFSALSLRGPHIDGAHALDGVFIAAHRNWIEHVGFDLDGYAGFHFYDIDFSYRSYLAGARIRIASDLGLIHFSRGPISEEWRTAQRTFSKKFGMTIDVPVTSSHWYSVPMFDREGLKDLYAKLEATWTSISLGIF